MIVESVTFVKTRSLARKSFRSSLRAKRPCRDVMYTVCTLYIIHLYPFLFCVGLLFTFFL